MRRGFAQLGHWATDVRGVSALEFALVAPIVLLTLFFTIEIGILMMTDATLTRVSGEISRSLQVHKGEHGVNCQNYIEERMKQGMHPLVEEGFFVRRESRYGAGEQFPRADATVQCSGASPGELLVYTVGFERTGFTGILSTLGISIMQLERRLLIQNEL